MEHFSPLSVSFVWNRNDTAVDEYLTVIRKHLSGDIINPFSRGLDIPTFYFTGNEGKEIPTVIPANLAEVNVVIIFTSLNTAGDNNWREYIKGLALNEKLDLVVVSIDEHGLSHSEDFNGLNFIRGYEWPSDNTALHATVSVLHEIYRFGFNLKDRSELGSSSSIKIFLSHAKSGGTGLQLAEDIKKFIDDTNMNQFFDASAISPSFDFKEEIIGHLKGSTVLAIVSDAYSSRYWCQKEILAAKALDRPIIILNSLEDYEDRSFPELTNVPVVRAHPVSPFPIVDILRTLVSCLVETIRHHYVINCLVGYQNSGWIDKEAEILSRPLEFRYALKNRENGVKSYCYPEPPIYGEESSWHELIGVRASTPLWQEGDLDSLMGVKVGISISNVAQDSDYEKNLHSNTLVKLSKELARHLLARSSQIIYGGDLRKNGFTDFILNEASVIKSRKPELDTVVENHLAWPLHMQNSADLLRWRANFNSVMKTIEYDLPEDLETIVNEDFILHQPSVENAYVWSRCLTEMRVNSIGESTVRVCAGGKRNNYKGCMPGVLEEIIVSLEQERPMFLIGGFGGIVHDVCELILTQDIPESLTAEWQVSSNADYQELQDFASNFGKEVNYGDIALTLSSTNISLLASRVGLSSEEYSRIMNSPFVDEVVYLCLKGLKKIGAVPEL